MSEKKGKYPNEFYALILSSITIFLASETTRPILPLYITGLGATLVELGIITGMLSISLIFTKIPLGIFAERVDSRVIIIGSGLAQSACQLLYSLTPVVIWFYPIQLLHAISIAPIVPLAIGRTQEFAPKGKTGVTLGIFLTSYGIAIAFGPFLCSILLAYLNYIQIFQIIAIIPLIGIVPCFSGVKFSHLESISQGTRPQVWAAFSYIRHSRNLGILTILRLLFALAYGFFVTYFIIYAEETILLAPFLIAFLLGIRGVADMALRIPVGKLVDRVDTKYVIILGFGTLSCVYYLLSETTNLFILFILMVFYGIALGFRVVAEWTMVANNSPDGCRSVVAAYLSTMFNIGSGVGEIFGGVLATFLAIPDLFRISSILMVIAVVIAPLLQKKGAESSIARETDN
jgi:predicted MFS family arabinose efflux permease